MKPGRTFTRPSGDLRTLAACVAALVDEAAQARLRLTREVPAAQMMQAPAVRPSEQLDLPWIDNFAMRLCDHQELEQAVKTSTAKGADNQAVASFLSDVMEQPVERALSRPPTRESLMALALCFPNFAPVVDFLLCRAALALLPPQSPLLLPPIVLNGPPGIGKTAFATELAEVLAVPLVTLQLAHATASFDLSGLDPKFAGGGPGLLVRAVALGPAVDPLILLDELDKVPTDRSYDPVGSLYSLLEPSTAAVFRDDGIKLPMNLRHVRWICTTNNIEALHPAIRSRCQVFEIEPPRYEEGRSIARQIYATLVSNHAWGRHFSAELPDDVADRLASDTPRLLTRLLQNALGTAALAGRSALVPADISTPDASRRGPGFL